MYSGDHLTQLTSRCRPLSSSSPRCKLSCAQPANPRYEFELLGRVGPSSIVSPLPLCFTRAKSPQCVLLLSLPICLLNFLNHHQQLSRAHEHTRGLAVNHSSWRARRPIVSPAARGRTSPNHLAYGRVLTIQCVYSLMFCYHGGYGRCPRLCSTVGLLCVTQLVLN